MLLRVFGRSLARLSIAIVAFLPRLVPAAAKSARALRRLNYAKYLRFTKNLTKVSKAATKIATNATRTMTKVGGRGLRELKNIAKPVAKRAKDLVKKANRLRSKLKGRGKKDDKVGKKFRERVKDEMEDMMEEFIEEMIDLANEDKKALVVVETILKREGFIRRPVFTVNKKTGKKKEELKFIKRKPPRAYRSLHTSLPSTKREANKLSKKLSGVKIKAGPSKVFNNNSNLPKGARTRFYGYVDPPHSQIELLKKRTAVKISAVTRRKSKFISEPLRN